MPLFQKTAVIIISLLLLALLFYSGLPLLLRYFREDINNLIATNKEDAIQLIKSCQVVGADNPHSGVMVLELADGKSIHIKREDSLEISEAIINRPKKCGPPVMFTSWSE